MELILSDDGSPDFPLYRERMETFLAHRKRDNLRSVQIISRDKNVGTVENLKNALSRSSGIFWKAFGMGDGFARPDALSRYVAKAEATGADLVFARARAFAPDGTVIAFIPSLKRHRYLASLSSRELFLLTMSYTAIISPGSFVRMSAYRDVGGFDSRFRIVEDYHFWLRCFQAGKTAVFLEDALAAYEVSASLIGSAPILSLDRIREKKLAFTLFNQVYDHRYGIFQGLFNALYLELNDASALRARTYALSSRKNGIGARLCRLEQGILKGILRLFFPPVPGKPRFPMETLSDKEEVHPENQPEESHI